jgi:hypothetical protein
MARSTRGARAREAAASAGSNPYLRRLVEDEELRHSLRDAIDAARDAYGRLSNGKGPARALVEDKKVHRDLRTASESLREAAERLRSKPKRRPFRKLVMVAILGGALALVLSEDLRKQVLDRLFGAEEEFEYTSTTSAPATETAQQSS